MAINWSDPYPGLRRKALFADVTGAEKVVSSLKRTEEVDVVDRGEKAREVLAVAEKGAEPLSAPKKRGRPAGCEGPWEAEGISRLTWDRRRKALKRDAEGDDGQD